nr:hypothetical protein [Tanacetum cinerariifolium]
MAARKPHQPTTVTYEEGGKKKKASKAVVEGKGKGIVSNEQATQSLLDLQKPKKKSITDQYIFQMRSSVTLDASTRPMYNIRMIHPRMWSMILRLPQILPMILKLVLIWKILTERTVKLDEGQARSNLGKTLESRPPPKREFIKEDQAGSDPGQCHVAQARPNPEPMHEDFIAIIYPDNLDDAFTFGDQFLNDISPAKEPRRANVETKVESMVTVPIQQAFSSIPLLSTPIIDLSPPKPIDKQINEVVKEAVHNALQAPLHKLFRDLFEFQMKETLLDRTCESGSYRSHPDHTTLYEALELSMQREYNDELHEALTTSHKRCRDDQDPLSPPPKDSNRSKKKKRDSDVSTLK